MEKVRGWIKRRPLVWAIGLLVVGLILGAAAGGSGKSGLESEKKELEAEVASVSSERGLAETRVATVEAQREKATEQLAEYSPAHRAEIKSESKKLIAEAKEEGASILQAKESEVEATEEELASVEGSVEGAQEIKAKSSIPDGTWQLEVDYVAGTYRAPGGPLCSWEQDQVPGGEANGEGFNSDYGIGETNILIEITAPYFKTQHCGTWHRVG
jgi:F0F1-type ATP synthase membrane subunit b/b'